MQQVGLQEAMEPHNPLSEATPHPNETEYLGEPRPTGEESPEHAVDYPRGGRSLRVTAMRGPHVDFSHA